MFKRTLVPLALGVVALTFNAGPALSHTVAAVEAVSEFNGGNGATPLGGLIKAADGQLYGTAAEGGKLANCTSGCGTVFRLTAAQRIDPAFKFAGEGRTPGHYPAGELVQAADGWLYDTTAYGGEEAGCTEGCGTVFRTSLKGERVTVARLTREVGANSYSALVQGPDGSLYGAAMRGGAWTTCTGGDFGCGTVFRLAPDGRLTALASFNGGNGASPSGPLVIGADGSLYGTTSYGGRFDKGVVFRLTPGGKLKTLAHFDGTHGSGPHGGLAIGPDGNFYGTTVLGGAFDQGTAFRLTPSGTLTTLLSFDGSGSGSRPFAGLVLAHDGALYGSTSSGGASNRGTLFRLTTDGVLTTLAQLQTGGVSYPYERLLEVQDGVFYSSASGGSYGVIYRLTVD